MTEHISAREIDAYRHRTLGGEEVVAVAEHLRDCGACRARAGSDDALGAAFAGLHDTLVAAAAGEVHLGYEDVERWVDGRLDESDRDAAAAHLEGCPGCAADVADLATLRSALQAEGLLREPKAAPPSAAVAARRPSWSSWPVLLLGMAAAAALAAWAVSIPLRNEMRAVRGQLPELQEAGARPQTASTTTGAPIVADGGGLITADGEGRFRGLPELSAPLAEWVDRALSTRRLDLPPRLADLGRSRETLMGGDTREGAAFALVEPLATVVESDRPVFHWQQLRGAEGYVVAVHDSRLRRVARSPRLRANQWVPPGPLPRGATYSWEVTALKDGTEITVPTAPAAEARFEVMPGVEWEQLQRARASYSDWHLLMAVSYARAGLVAEAQRELQALARANPGSSLPRELQASLARKP